MLLERLSKQSGLGESQLLRIAETASKRYKVYTIPKRSGGERIIEHPSRELKAIQRWLIKNLFDSFPLHHSATAYAKGSSVRKNAELHRQFNYTVRYDFREFFPSFSGKAIRRFLEEEAGGVGLILPYKDIKFVRNIVCRYERLTIGAPSSPIISNIMMFKFDDELCRQCAESGMVYTRYADDIFVSSVEPGSFRGLGLKIKQIADETLHAKLRINGKKTTYLSRKYRRQITGVVITPDYKLSVGRHRKREIRALIHEWINGHLSNERVGYLRGVLAYARDVEPNLEERLKEKYGADAIDRLLHEVTIEYNEPGDRPPF